jgi:hypothetical protein
VTYFSTSIPVKRSSTKLFGVTQSKSESTQTYLNILKIKKLLDLVALKALIRGVREDVIWRKLYALSNRNLLEVK